jgi:hypothetical protein
MYALIHIHKTAGTTLKYILRRNFGPRHFDTTLLGQDCVMTAGQLARLRRISPRLRSLAGHGVRAFSDLHEAVPNLRYYTFVRDPIGRNLSNFMAWLADDQGKCGFPDTLPELRRSFLRMVEERANWQTRSLAGVADAERAIGMFSSRITFVGLVERFDESLVMLRRWMPDVDLDIRYHRLNVSRQRLQHGRWAAATAQRLDRIRGFAGGIRDDDQLMAELTAHNREDLKLLEHLKNSVYPRQQRQYGDRLANDLARFQADQQASRLRRRDSLTGRAYRHLVLKPLAPWLRRQAA